MKHLLQTRPYLFWSRLQVQRDIAVCRSSLTIAGSALILLFANSHPAVAGKLTLIGPPGALSSMVDGFDGRTVGGMYWTAVNPWSPARGYVYDVVGATYLTFDLPHGGPFNAVSGTTVVGNYATGFYSTEGYLYDAATSRYIPVQAPGATSTYAADISGNYVVGDYWLGDYHDHPSFAYVYDGNTYTTLLPPGGTASTALRVDGNIVLGNYRASDTETYGFVYDLSTSTYTSFAPPGGTHVLPTVLGDSLVAGDYLYFDGRYHQGEFLYDIATSSYLSFDAPGPIADADGGNLVGTYGFHGHGVGYLYNIADGTYISFAVGGATDTNFIFLSGDKVAGIYDYNVDGNDLSQAFLVDSPANTPFVPEPSTLSLAVVASALLSGSAVRHIRALGKRARALR